MPHRGVPTYWVDDVEFVERDGAPVCLLRSGGAEIELRGKPETLVRGLGKGRQFVGGFLRRRICDAVVLPFKRKRRGEVH